MTRQSHVGMMAGLYLLVGAAAIGGPAVLAGWRMHGMAIYQTLVITGITCL